METLVALLPSPLALALLGAGVGFVLLLRHVARGAPSASGSTGIGTDADGGCSPFGGSDTGSDADGD